MQNKRLFRSLVFSIALITLLISSIANSSSKVYSLGMGNLRTPNKLNLLIMVKASQDSNRLANNDLGAKTKLEIMRESILSIFEQNLLPPNTNIGIMAFGHKFDKTDYTLTCSAKNIEMVLSFQLASAKVDSTKFMDVRGMGESPITLALEEAAKTFPKPSPDTLNVILLIAGGPDTCNSNPGVKAKILFEEQNIIIYTISFLAGPEDLEALAQNSSGKYFNVPGSTNSNQRASEELNKAIRSAFDDILARVSAPVLPPNTPTISTPTDMATPIPTNMTIPATAPTDTLPQPTSETISPLPSPTEEQPSIPFGTLGIFTVAAILFLGILGFGFWVRKSQKTTKVLGQTTLTESIITVDERLEDFWKDLDKAYASGGAREYIPLEVLKQKLSSKYTQEQFDELLIQVRRKYPNKIWIDKDSKGQTLVKINL
jgi:hypothetical protein